jgi:hypothetical protein
MDTGGNTPDAQTLAKLAALRTLNTCFPRPNQ